MKVLQVNYKFPKPITEKMDKPMPMAVEGAKHISSVSGLRWKIYCYDRI